MLFTKDASYYAEQIKSGQTTSQELVQAALENIERLNPKINAVVHVQKDAALKHAKELDHIFKLTSHPEKLPPFFGIPILLKDLGQNQAGQPSTSGSALLQENISAKTDKFVLDLQKAGFVIVGRTNVPEFGFKGVSDSAYYGKVSMPLDLSRNAGGSSGGAAAALQAGVVPIVTGSDGGGSIRMPASFTGTIGLKPTRGRIAVGPNRYRGWQGAAIDFSLTKSIRDTWSLLRALQVEEGQNPFPLSLIKENALADLHRPLKIAYSTQGPDGVETDLEAVAAIKHTVQVLKELGHTVVEDFPNINLKEVLNSYFLMNGVETAAMFDGFAKKFGQEVQADQVEPLSYGIYLSGQNTLAKEYTKMLAFWDQTAAIVEDFLEDYDLILIPTTNGPAPKHGELFDTVSEDLKQQLLTLDQYETDQQKEILNKTWTKAIQKMPFTQVQNLTGQTAISLPLYKTADGLPIGSQFWAGKGQEYLLLQLGKQLEDKEALSIQTITNL